MKFIIALLLIVSVAHSKQIALTFDDAPGDTTLHFNPEQRTDELIRKLKVLKVPPVLIFANPCNGNGATSNFAQLKKFKEAGHIIGNHTCTHPRFDDVGPDKFIADTVKAEVILGDLMPKPKYFRYPFFNEGKSVAARDQFITWLEKNEYQNVSSSLENEDPTFSGRINEAKRQNKKIDYEKIKVLFLKHIIDGVEFYDKLAIDTLGRSPKHIILLHDKDATVLFIEDFVHELKNRGWTFISASEAAKDPLYSMKPKNVVSSYGILAQVAYEKNGSFKPYYDFDKLQRDLNSALGLKSKK